MSLYTRTAHDNARPLGDIPRDAFDVWLKAARKAAQDRVESFRQFPSNHPGKVAAVNAQRSLMRFGGGITNVLDPLKGFQEGLIAYVLGDAGALRYARSVNAEHGVIDRILGDYNDSVVALATYTGGDVRLIRAASEDQDGVIRAALAHR